MMWSREDCRWIEAQARALGFDLAGVAAVPDADTVEAQRDAERFAEWVDAGRAGEMDWLKRVNEEDELLRGDLRRAMPWARSVIVCALNYNQAAPRSTDSAPANAGWIARYAWSGKRGPDDEEKVGADYHDLLLQKLRAMEAAISERFSATNEMRCYVDTGPIVERSYAERAGIGWVGKNTCVLNQELGSWLLLGVIVTGMELAVEALPTSAVDRCGSCTRCIDACPTDALIAPRVMDASLCIAYLTIEKKGIIDEALREKMGRQVFGCDICQDVCPWNSRAPVGVVAEFEAREQMVNPALDWLASLDGAGFNRWFRGSPLERTGRKRLRRNVAIAMGNSGERDFAPTLQKWKSEEDATLAEAAAWALEKLNKLAQ